MRKVPLIVPLILISCSRLLAGVPDPIVDFKTWYPIEDSSYIYQWTAKINVNEKPSVFLCTDRDYIEGQKTDKGLSLWSLYVPDSNGGHRFIRDVIREDGTRYGGVLLDLDCLYIGKITQLGKRGLVTMSTNREQKHGPEPKEPITFVYVRAFIPVDDHFEEKILTKCDIKADNDIYKQYLSQSKRTAVKMERISIR